jgi:hypothetical protein
MVRLGEVMANRRKMIVTWSAIVVASYLGLTWLFFGSPHPCGIFEARWKLYAIEIATKLQWDRMRDEDRQRTADKIPQSPHEAFERLRDGKASNRDRLAIQIYLNLANARNERIRNYLKSLRG